MKKVICLFSLFMAASLSVFSQNPEVRWDKQSLIISGRRVMPVMGEIHYSRIPAAEWKGEVRKMKDGGVTIIATYVFWNHVEEQEGIFNWSGQRDLRRFLEICKEEGLPVILRVGPFCHGKYVMAAYPTGLLRKVVRCVQRILCFCRLLTVSIDRSTHRYKVCNGKTAVH